MLGYGLNLCYALLLAILSPYFLYVSIRKKKYRRGWGEKFLGRCPIRSGTNPCIWFHAVSVGEVQLLAPLLQKLAREQPQITCVISTTTQTGRALAEKNHSEHLVFYCPLDFTWAVRQTLQRIRPSLLVLSELELWPNLILSANHRGVATAVINGRLSKKSFRGYHWLRPLVQHMLCSLRLIAVQSEEYADRFRALGAPKEKVRVTGSVKFDGAQTDRNNPKSAALTALAGIREDETVFLAGSTQHPEEVLAIETFLKLQDEYPAL
ncbi:MAG: glycosyltransferase N-terminal domain-containing protein, partial [Pirellulales bacterium]|nr:glycosyltransferase N-terminal domain-containing protein [Pirellulales bacterium]